MGQSPNRDRRVRFAVDMPNAEPTKQNQRVPIKMVGGRVWSPGIYRSLRVLLRLLEHLLSINDFIGRVEIRLH